MVMEFLQSKLRVPTGPHPKINYNAIILCRKKLSIGRIFPLLYRYYITRDRINHRWIYPPFLCRFWKIPFYVTNQ